MGLKWLLFQPAHFVYYMKHVISMRWLANPNKGPNHFSHNFITHYQSEDSHAHGMVINTSPPPWSIMLTIKPKMVIVVFDTCLWGDSYLEPHHMKNQM